MTLQKGAAQTPVEVPKSILKSMVQAPSAERIHGKCDPTLSLAAVESLPSPTSPSTQLAHCCCKAENVMNPIR